MQHRTAFSGRRAAFGIFFAGIVVALVYLAAIAAPTSAQENEDCANPTEVDTFTTTPDTTDEFNITGDEFRVRARYDSEDEDATLEITFFEDNRATEESFTVSGGQGSRIIPLGPGDFQLEIQETGNIDSATITVEDCAGETEDGATEDQYDDDGDDNGDDSVINVPDKDLPNTGGFPPLLVVGFFLVAGAGLATALLRRRY